MRYRDELCVEVVNLDRGFHEPVAELRGRVRRRGRRGRRNEPARCIDARDFCA